MRKCQVNTIISQTYIFLLRTGIMILLNDHHDFSRLFDFVIDLRKFMRQKFELFNVNSKMKTFCF